ncbi:MAG: patatin-like phospholipase family protein [Gemmatimonadaceae bacterium]
MLVAGPALILLVLTAAAGAQDTSAVTAPRPRIGLVLSGGSAKGFAHIGVIATLEKLGVPIDIVTGTSMGSAIGGFYAIGYTAGELREIAANQDWTGLLSDRRSRDILIPDRRELGARTVISFPLRGGRIGLPSGIVRGDAIMRLLERVTWRAQAVRDFTRLPLPFSAVATDVETGEAVVLSSGVLAHAIRASMAITGVIQPVRINNRLLMDGGVARNLPAQDARALGADILICSDVSGPLQKGDELRSLFDIVFQTVAFSMAAHNEEQRRLCDVLIQPDVEGLSTFSFVEFDDWIARGETAATAYADTLRKLAVIAAPARGRPVAPLLPDSVLITEARVVGVSTDAARNVVQRALDLDLPRRLSAWAFDRALSRLSATNLFARVTYRLDVTEADTIAVIEVEAQPQDQIGLGFRYDDHRKAALLFTGTLHNRLQYGSTLDVDLRLGEPTQFGASYLAGRGIVSDVNMGAEARYTRALLDLFEGGERVADIRTHVASLAGVVGRTISRTTVAGLRIGVENIDAETRIAESDTAQHRTYYTAAALLWRDTFDRTAFPTRGIALRARSVIGNDRLGGSTSFVQHLLDVEQIVPLTRRTVLRLHAIAGGGTGADLPLHRQFFLGGTHLSPAFPETQPIFWGLEPQERPGAAVHVARISLQREILRDVYATVGVNAGNAFARWVPRDFSYILGWAASLGMATPIGPLEAMVSGRNLGEWPAFSVSVGPSF